MVVKVFPEQVLPNDKQRGIGGRKKRRTALKSLLSLLSASFARLRQRQPRITQIFENAGGTRISGNEGLALAGGKRGKRKYVLHGCKSVELQGEKRIVLQLALNTESVSNCGN